MVGHDVAGQARRLEAIAELADRIRARAPDLDARAAFPAETFAELREAHSSPDERDRPAKSG